MQRRAFLYTASTALAAGAFTPVALQVQAASRVLRGGRANLTLVVAARRTTGVAPFSVHFEVTGSTSTSVSDTYRRVWYEWDFGETSGPGVAAWTVGVQNRTRNTAHGPIAAHLYEVPGTYTATVRGYVNGILANTETVSITVQDPEVVYLNKTMTYDNTGTGSATKTITSSFDTVVSTIVSKGNGWRHQLKGGDSFSIAVLTGEVNNNIRQSDITIESYGSGNANITFTGTGASSSAQFAFSFGGQSAPTQARIIVKDVLVDGSTSTATDKPDCVRRFSGLDLCLVRIAGNSVQMIIRDSMHGDKYNFNRGDTAHVLHDGFSMWDCTLPNPVANTTGNPPYGAFVGANYYTIQGCDFDVNGGSASGLSHRIRQWHGYKGVIANNKLSRSSGPAAHSLKIHSETEADINSYTWTGPQTWANSIVGPNSASGGRTDYIWCCDNDIEASYSTNPVAFGSPSNSGNDSGTRVYHIGFVGNRVRSGPNAVIQFGTCFWAQSGIIANNVYEISTSASSRHVVIHIGTRFAINGSADGPDVLPGSDVIIENNSAYIASSATGVAMMLAVQDVAVDVKSRNNAIWAPNDTGGTYASSSTTVAGVAITAVGYTSSNDSTNAQMRQASTPYASATPSTVANFAPAVGSYLRSAGASYAVQRDIYGTARPMLLPDMGALVAA